MAQPLKSDKDKKITACLDFTAQLIRGLEAGNVNADVLSELETHIQRHLPVPVTSKAHEFDQLGTKLWNAILRLKDQSSPLLSKKWPRLEPQLRVHAFLLLDLAQRAYLKHGSKKSTQNAVRTVKTALKAARICINADEFDLSIRIFEKVADYVEHRQHVPSNPKSDKDGCEAEDMIQELAAEYYLLRATLTWKQGKPDNVPHWLGRVGLLLERTDLLHLAEKKADLTYEIGKAALKKKDFENAVRWLEQSSSVFENMDSDSLSPECYDLRLVAMLDLARSLIGVGTAALLDRASDIVVILDQENGFKMEVSMLKLDIIFSRTPFQATEFHKALVRVIKTAMISEGTLKAIMHQIHRLNSYTPEKGLGVATALRPVLISNPGPYSHLASATLDNLISRLLASPLVDHKWLEKSVVTRIWIGSLSLHGHEHLQKLGVLCDEIHGVIGTTLSSQATHASQSLIWKAASACQQAQDEALSSEWCTLACHVLFSNAGELNKAKLGRKMIMSAIARGDAAAARQAYFQMPDSGKSAAMTQYLMYKIALREGDVESASQSLENVFSASSHTEKFLYACVLEAQQTGNRMQAIESMNKVLELFERKPTMDVRLPVLLRSIAGAIQAEISSGDMPEDVGFVELCKIFEAAMRHAVSFRDASSKDSDTDTRIAEIRWFACHSYNTALKKCSDMHPEVLLRFMMAAISLLDQLRREGEKDNSLVSRSLVCRFLSVSTLIVMARSEDNVERALQQYIDARRQVQAFHTSFAEARAAQLFDEEIMSDLAGKEFEMIKFDLEALMRLEHWNDLDRLLSMCLDQRHTDRLESAADLILHLHTHIVKAGLEARFQAKIPHVMEKIISISWRNNKDITRLARWIRCVFQMTLNFDPVMSLRCVDQACAIASRIQTMQTPDSYPRDEIEWLSTMTFNHAFDLHFAADDEEMEGGTTGSTTGSQVWAEKALSLAMTAGETSGLHGALQEKWMQLRDMGKGS